MSSAELYQDLISDGAGMLFSFPRATELVRRIALKVHAMLII
jgi:hypothetical protein